MKNIVEGSFAAAKAVQLCKPDVIAVYPITPQTHIPEELAKMIANGELDSEMVRVESEHSAMAACIGSQATGVRSYTATSSQGLALMHEMLFVASGMRLPIVMTNVNRTLSAPINIWNDMQDSFAERDSGWIQLYCENAQEVFDTHIQAFRIAEETLLPVMVCLDGYIVSHTSEPVEFLSEEKVRKFLPEYKPRFSLNPSKPITMGSLGTPEHFIYFKKQQDEAMEKALEVIRKVNREYSSISGRLYGNGLIETVNMQGKDSALITLGSVAGTARHLLDKMGIGLIRFKSLRPFPAEELEKACQNLKSVGVLEKDISLGCNGALYNEVRSALYGLENKPKVSGFIAGLGGRDITLKDMEMVMKKIKDRREGVEWLI